MSDRGEIWWDGLRQDAEAPASEPPRSRGSIIAALAAAALAAAGLGWWLTMPDPTSGRSDILETAQRAPRAEPAPGAAADAEQVRRAYDEFRAISSAGPEALARFRESCAGSLRADARILDFCLAFEIFADQSQGVPPGAETQLALAASALPAGGDPAARLADVRRLAAEVSGDTTLAEAPVPSDLRGPAVVAAEPPPPAALARAPAAPPAADARRPAPKLARATRSTRPAANARCEGQTPADRLLCGNSVLQAQDRRMKAAYEKALAAGANPLEVDRQQAEWRQARDNASSRSELATAYQRRIAELEAAARRAANEPPI